MYVCIYDDGVGDDVGGDGELTAHCNDTFNYHRLQNYLCFMLHDSRWFSGTDLGRARSAGICFQTCSKDLLSRAMPSPWASPRSPLRWYQTHALLRVMVINRNDLARGTVEVSKGC